MKTPEEWYTILIRHGNTADPKAIIKFIESIQKDAALHPPKQSMGRRRNASDADLEIMDLEDELERVTAERDALLSSIKQ